MTRNESITATEVPPAASVVVSLPKKAKPSKAASKDALRPVLCAGFIKQTTEIVDGERQVTGSELQVTNRYVAVRVPLDVVASEGFVSPDALVAFEKAGVATFTAETVTVHSAGATFERRDQGLYPNFDGLWPEPYSNAVSVTVEVKQLVAVAAALGAGTLTLTLNADNTLRPILVTADDADGEALVMAHRPKGS